MSSKEKEIFNSVAGSYDELMQESMKNYGSDLSYYSRHKVNIVKKFVSTPVKSVLEFGCGTGRNIPFLRAVFPQASVSGCDISDRSLSVAAEKNPGTEFFLLNDVKKPEKKFDLVFIAGVFHHIPPDQRRAAMVQVAAFLRPGGEVFIFEHNPFNPLTRKTVKECPFDEGVELLRKSGLETLCRDSGLNIIHSRYTLFFPAFAGFLSPLEHAMGFLPAGGQYFIHAQSPGEVSP